MAIFGFIIGVAAYFVYRCIVTGFYTVLPNERAVITVFGKAQRLEMEISPIEASALSEDEKSRYNYPVLKTIQPGGPYFKWPWMKVHKVDVQTQSLDLTWDPTKSQETIEAVTKDNLTIGVDGQIRFRVSENHLYPYLFGVKSPLEHVMGFFVSVLRERIATFTDPKGTQLIKEADVGDDADGGGVDITEGVSINDLRKNLPLLNDYMEEQCRNTPERYGIELDAALITEIDPPSEVDSALSSINSTRNQVAADISTARADAEQQITMSYRAVEIASNKAHAEVAPLNELARTLMEVKNEGGSSALKAYMRNMRVPLLGRATRVVETTKS